jgi:hypothetical protein
MLHRPDLDMGGMNCNTQQQAERVDENVSLAARDLLACIEALRIERGPPFCAALALWLSMIAVVGLAWRPRFCLGEFFFKLTDSILQRRDP